MTEHISAEEATSLLCDLLRAAGEAPFDIYQKAEFAADKLKEFIDQNRWVPVSERLPDENQQVLAKYEGYAIRLVVYWIDEDGKGYFGLNDEWDGKGSQPATHWRPIKAGN